jgi:RHS repeat-associated protein
MRLCLDDANAFYDRSLGAQSHGTSVAGPYQLKSASNRTTASTSLYKGGLEAQYDAAGNLTGMIVQRDTATANCLPSGASCWQRYAYAWDEVGRLMSASRWDLRTSTTASANERTNSGVLAKPVPTRTPDARMAYLYDGADERVVKTTIDSAGVQRHTVDVFANYKLRLTRQAGTGTLADYTLDQTTEQVELQSHGVTVGRVEVIPTTASTVTTPGQRTLLVLHDALGSAGIVLDRATGQLAEAVTYTAYGQTESDYRPPRFSSNREDERFTGKEEDVEIGLVYFGKRYLVPAMARWASADPLAVHAPGEADLNLYAYVHGRVYVAVDPNGLEAFKEEGIGTDDEIRATVAAGYKDGRIKADERNPETKRQLEEWISTGSITMGKGKERGSYKVDRGIGQLLANLVTASTPDLPTEVLSLGRAPTSVMENGHGRRDGWIEAVDLSRMAGERTDLSVGSVGANADAATWNSRRSEAIRGVSKLLAAMPKALLDVGLTRPGVPRGWVDPDSDHHPFINELEGHSNACAARDCRSLRGSLPWMSAEAQKVLAPVVDKMQAFVRSAYPDGADHVHVQRPAGVHTR